MNRYRRPPASHFNWFLTIRPPLDVATRIRELGSRLRDQHELRGSLRPREILHISLHGLGEGSSISEDLLRKACEAAEQTSLLAPLFEVGFGRVVNFGRPSAERPLVLTHHQKGENADLMRFYRMLGRALKSCEIPVDLNFTPHVTMFYGDEPPEVSVERVSWLIEEFELVCSHVGHSKYETLGRWKLRGESFPPEAPSTNRANLNPAQTELGF